MYQDFVPPLYRKIAGAIRINILSGLYQKGDKLPTMQSLVSQYNVSLITIRKALALLENDKIITIHPGKGVFVNEITPYATPSILSGNLREMGQQILSYKIKLVGQSEIAVFDTGIAPAISGFLKIPQSAKIGFLQRVALTEDGTPVYYLENFMPANLAGRLTKEELEGNSLIRILEKKFGLEFEKAKMIMTFSNPLVGDVVRHLACSESEPLIRMQISSYLKNAEPVQMTLIYVKAENFYYQVDLNYELT
jgi:DNA-binding GntR family transcriptional regulator